ncbi:MAG: hypothetical protein RL076_1319 [Chloroflexota bacterium]
MQTTPTDINVAHIQHLLTTHRLGRQISHLAVTPSTNDDIRQAALTGAAEGLVVIADAQTHGRGQYGRTWSNTPRAQLMASLLLRPSWLAPQHTIQLINAFVVVLAETLTPLLAAPVTLKWPNDVLIAGRKVAGVIAEARRTPQHLTSVCIGWGLNVHDHPHTAQLATQSTALTHWTDATYDRNDLLARQLNAFEPVYDQLAHDPLMYHTRWYTAMHQMVGQTRTVTTGTQTIHGTVTALNDDGSIVIDGQTIHTGMLDFQ